MKKFKIYIHPPLVDEKDKASVLSAMERGYVAPDGPFNRLFEEKLCKYLQVPHAVTLQSGTAALHLALKNLGLGKGDYVLVPTHTFVASVSPVLYEKAIPVLVESSAGHLNMSPGYLEKALHDLKKQNIRPKAVIIVHLYGLSAQVKELMEIARKYEIPIIEDAAESLGTIYQGKYTGTFASQGILSFNGNKVITTSGGGALITHRKAFAERARFLSAHAKEEKDYFFHREIGHNYQLSNLLAALGVSQLEKLEKYIARKRKIHAMYQKSGLSLVDEMPGERSNYWLNILQLPGDVYAQDLMDYMAGKGIETRRLWYPLHLMPAFDHYPYYGASESKRWFDRYLLLPSGPGLTDEEVEEVAMEVKRFMGDK